MTEAMQKQWKTQGNAVDADGESAETVGRRSSVTADSGLHMGRNINNVYITES
jgi:hypothetical protein